MNRELETMQLEEKIRASQRRQKRTLDSQGLIPSQVPWIPRPGDSRSMLEKQGLRLILLKDSFSGMRREGDGKTC